MNLLVVMPTRGRPGRFAEFLDAFSATRSHITTRVLACVDDDDPTLGSYPPIPNLIGRYSTGPRAGFMPRLNREAVARCDENWGAIASFGDDHVPRTVGWDRHCLDALRAMGGGVVYPNDGFQAWKCATAPVISTDIVRALGWFAPPQLAHFYVDDFWLELGHRLGRLRYLGDVLVEHMHPAAGKAEPDATYSGEEHHAVPDLVRWDAYERDGLADDVARVRAALR